MTDDNSESEQSIESVIFAWHEHITGTKTIWRPSMQVYELIDELQKWHHQQLEANRIPVFMDADTREKIEVYTREQLEAKVADARSDEHQLVEQFREALMQAHHHDWDMETVSEAAHICARSLNGKS